MPRPFLGYPHSRRIRGFGYRNYYSSGSSYSNGKKEWFFEFIYYPLQFNVHDDFGETYHATPFVSNIHHEHRYCRSNLNFGTIISFSIQSWRLCCHLGFELDTIKTPKIQIVQIQS